MTLAEYLDQLGDPSQILAPRESADLNLGLLVERIDRGAKPVLARLLDAGVASLGGPCFMFVVQSPELDDEHENLIVWAGPRALELFRTRLRDVPMSVSTSSEPQPPKPQVGELLPAELREVIEQRSELAPEQRAAALMDWIMERIEASRCALVPYDGGVAAPPLDFSLRGQVHGSQDLRHVPRQILAHVARTRQPLVSHDVTDPENVLPAEATVLHQKIRSYMAVPVLFRGNLLAVCYVDRFDQPRRFSDEEQRVFTAFAYEIATPLLRLLEEKRRLEYQELRDAYLDSDSRASVAEMSSPAFAQVLERARVLAPHIDENLLILGETGVGKEHLARLIHERSGRGEKPFTPVNLSAIPSEVFESELMGSVRGAFTDARDRPGRIVEADGGTVFLDEIGDLSLLNQVNLLRFLQTKSVRPVGGSSERPVDVRVIAATNRPLRQLVATGEFRADLLHRFAPPLVVPPLRDRQAELLPRAESFLDEIALRKGIVRPQLTDDARRFLRSYGWPGNIRQLHLLLTHAALLATEAKIDRSLLVSLTEGEAPSNAAMESADVPVADTWDEFRELMASHERAWLERVFEAHGGNISATARKIGCPATTLRSALERHGLV